MAKSILEKIVDTRIESVMSAVNKIRLEKKLPELSEKEIRTAMLYFGYTTKKEHTEWLKTAKFNAVVGKVLELAGLD